MYVLEVVVVHVQQDTLPHHEFMIFPDLSSNASDEDVSLAFFEMANDPTFQYRLNDKLLTLHQDVSACGQHTGGIVWETSVLLLHYLLEKKLCWKKQIVEVGAGCGLLGMGLAASNHAPMSTVLTEAEPVSRNLATNLAQNKELVHNTKSCTLDWTSYQQDAEKAGLRAGIADIVLGTDVLFSPALVRPLLDTLSFLCNDRVYLCVQTRCATSHQRFFQLAEESWDTEELTEELLSIPSCSWGPGNGCHLFCLSKKKTG